MSTLSTELRNKLERTIVRARDVAEAGAKASLEALAVHHHEPYGHMSIEERRLRNHLRAKARQLGDKQNQKGELEITHLTWECAYEHWHRMLFARFLAENDLLIEPEMGVAISLEECEELAKEDGKDLWTLASEFAQRMLPQIFRPNDPVLRVTFASEHRLSLEKLLNDLEPAIFTASDSLGWVYQFWQSKRKKEVNESGNKIGADELPAVTQLFTEPYMVSFLLDNSLGAWWVSRVAGISEQGSGKELRSGARKILKTAKSEEELRRFFSLPGVPLEYLRFVKLDNGTWTPTAGTFDGWPEHLSELKTLDPCCGSGHFIVAALLMLVPMRMKLEGLTAHKAVDAVLSESIHGLEIDQRCVELAVFALALTAWRYPNAGGYRPLPELNVACSGLAISAKKEEWLALAGDNTNLRMALEQLYKQFKDAPVLGSLINPGISLAQGSLFELQWEQVGPLLTKALVGEKDDEKTEMGVVANGIVKASRLLSHSYHLVFTNVPYLGKGKMNETLIEFLQTNYGSASNDLATAMIARMNLFVAKEGIISFVSSQNWMFLGTFSDFRQESLTTSLWALVARLGYKSFSTPMYDFPVVLCIFNRKLPSEDFFLKSICAEQSDHYKKIVKLKKGSLISVKQVKQIRNPKSRVIFDLNLEGHLIPAKSTEGLSTGDSARYLCKFWEQRIPSVFWSYYQASPTKGNKFDGLSYVLLWENGLGELSRSRAARIQGNNVWERKGIIVGRVGGIRASTYLGVPFDKSAVVLTPTTDASIESLYAFCISDEFEHIVRQIDKKLGVATSVFESLPFDQDHWTSIAQEKYSQGLPKPYSNDPTQWIFHGHPVQSDEPLQVAVARLLGYRWPAELDLDMDLSGDARAWVKKSEALLPFSDEDGIVCIPPVRGEESAADQLRELLLLAFGQGWHPAKEKELIQTTEVTSSNLDKWLRDHFFEQHCKLFHHRPFIWHIWDGRRRDGFHALVNYHKLAEGNGKGRQLLENLTYSYLGDWIARQKEGVKRGEGGAEDRLAAALELQKRLIAIIEGEPPFDIFVRWKPIEEQPVGWEPDINDGVRMNIRPFMANDIPGGRKGAGILRWKPNIKWNKDRGKEPSRPKEQYPWFWQDGEFTGDRVNDIHLSINDKQKARK